MCCPGGEGGRCCPGGEGGVVQRGGGREVLSTGGEGGREGRGGCCPGGGGAVTWSLVAHLPPPRVGQTDACEIITFARFATRAVKTLKIPVCGNILILHFYIGMSYVPI